MFRELHIYSPAHHHAGLVIKTIIHSHRLTHMFVKVQLFIIVFLQQAKKTWHVDRWRALEQSRLTLLYEKTPERLL